jgi:putative peptidoglycan lipid II flippase
VIANQIALLIVIVLANERDGGAFAYLSAYAFFQLPHGLFAVSIMTAAAPELAAAGGRGDLELRHRFSRALRLTLTVLIPAAAVLVALARPIVVAILERGAFSGTDAALVADILVGFAAGLPFFSTYLFALRAFYSLQDTKRPFLLNCFENGMNIVLALVLFESYGLPGLAYAFSAAYAVAAVVTLVVLSRELGGLSGRGIETSALKVVAVSIAAGAVAWLAGQAIGWADSDVAIGAVAAGGLAAAAVTAGGLALLRVAEFTDLLDLVRTRRTRREPAGDDAPAARR